MKVSSKFIVWGKNPHLYPRFRILFLNSTTLEILQFHHENLSREHHRNWIHVSYSWGDSGRFEILYSMVSEVVDED